MDVMARLDEARAAIDVLKHPFYQRWSAGELSAGELSRYAGEYRHAVVALARASALAAEAAPTAERPGLLRHAEEERAHVSLWDQFERAAATACEERSAQPRESTDESALEQTKACAEAWTAGEDVLERLAVLYAIEASQPAISTTKLEGLTAHYGFSEEGPATEYFRVHELRDVEHAGAARELIGRLMRELRDGAERENQADRMVRRASDALRGNWALLDGVEAARAAA